MGIMEGWKPPFLPTPEGGGFRAAEGVVSIASQKQEAARVLFIVSRRLFIRSHVYQTVIYGRLPRFRKWVIGQGYDPGTLTRDQKQRLLNLYVNIIMQWASMLL